jgi:hypothetical protein
MERIRARWISSSEVPRGIPTHVGVVFVCLAIDMRTAGRMRLSVSITRSSMSPPYTRPDGSTLTHW